MAKKISLEHEEHLFICDGATASPRNAKQIVHQLKSGKKHVKDEIHLEIGALKEILTDNLSAVMKDLLEIATFVYAAGQLTSRGGDRELDYGYKWHRTFDLAIPVSEYQIWTDYQVKELLETLLSFVAGENYTFHFSQKRKDNNEFLGLHDSVDDPHHIQEVVLFSGGMDSFAGAVDEIAGQGKKVALISHCSEPKMTGLQKSVYSYLKDNCAGPAPLHVPVHIWKGGEYITKDTNQRSRSFLFASLGAIVAKTIGLNHARFYENGIISCNLPFDGQTLQARRTRSTHPRFLTEMSELVERITSQEFRFENPYFPMTRTDVVKRIVSLQHSEGISKTRSCAKSRYNGPRHDGVCSQCVDRRFSTIAANCIEYDPEDDYSINIFTDEIDKTQHRTMILGYVYLANKVSESTKEQFFERFSSDLIEIINNMPMPKSEAVSHLYNLYRNHAQHVTDVLSHQIQQNTNVIISGIPKHCLLNMVAQQKHKKLSSITDQGHAVPRKHGKGKLNEAVENLLAKHNNPTATKLASLIGNTTPGAVCKTAAWIEHQKKQQLQK